MDDFSAFLLKFQTQRDMEAGGIAAPYYLRALKAASRSSQGRKDVSLLHINCRHLHTHSKVLYKQLVRYPQEIIPMMETIAAEQLKSMRAEDFGDEEDDEAEAEGASRPRKTKVQVMPFNLRELHDVRDLDPENIDQLVSISGMVTRTSSVVPDLKSAHYRCVVCSGSQVVEIDRGAVDEPSKCARSNCGAKGAMELVHNRCIFGDKQIIRLQEAPSSIPEGETPHTTTIFGFDDLVDAVRPGDRVECTGIFRAIPKRVNPRITAVRSVYRTYIDAIHFRVRGDEGAEQAGDDAGPDAESEGNTAAREKLEAIKRFAQQGDTYARLSKALAPSIYGMEDVKRGVLCMLFGGVARERSYEEAPQRPAPGDAPAPGAAGRRTTGASNPGGRTRGDINVLLCGDPGTSKSQLLSYVHKLAPRGVYASGKGSSAVGLTASVTRDPETRELVMESGAVVLSDLGVCCIDEFDKMSEATRAVLHEAMEQQTISLAKAGIVATLNARASILASANPKASRYDPKLSVVENIQLPPTLLSRFDLIYLILDAADADADRRLAKHIVGLYHQNVQLPKTDVDEAFVRDYIAYARAKVMPELGDEARTELIEAYVKMRGGSGRRRNARTITATPRQLEGLIRIAESLARMRLET